MERPGLLFLDSMENTSEAEGRIISSEEIESNTTALLEYIEEMRKSNAERFRDSENEEDYEGSDEDEHPKEDSSVEENDEIPYVHNPRKRKAEDISTFLHNPTRVALTSEQWQLLVLWHATKCQNHSTSSCPITSQCQRTKQLWRHIESCKKSTMCEEWPLCLSSRRLLAHYATCKDYHDCKLCRPVRDFINKRGEFSVEWAVPV